MWDCQPDIETGGAVVHWNHRWSGGLRDPQVLRVQILAKIGGKIGVKVPKWVSFQIGLH